MAPARPLAAPAAAARLAVPGRAAQARAARVAAPSGPARASGRRTASRVYAVAEFVRPATGTGREALLLKRFAGHSGALSAALVLRDDGAGPPGGAGVAPGAA